MFNLKTTAALIFCCFVYTTMGVTLKKQKRNETTSKSSSWPSKTESNWIPSKPMLKRRYENGGEYFDEYGYSKGYDGHGYYAQQEQPHELEYGIESPRYQYRFYDPVGKAYVRVELEHPLFHGRTFSSHISTGRPVTHSNYVNTGQSSAYSSATNSNNPNSNSVATATYGVSFGPVTTTTTTTSNANSNSYGGNAPATVMQSGPYSTPTSGYGSYYGSGYASPTSGNNADYYYYSQNPNGGYGSYGSYGITDNRYTGYTYSGYSVPPQTSGYVGYGGTSNYNSPTTNPVSYRANSERPSRWPFFNENAKSPEHHHFNGNNNYNQGYNNECNHH